MEQHTLHNLAEKFEKHIKESIAQQFSDSADALVLLTDKKDGVYVSREDPATFCCLAVGKQSKFLYLVTATIGDDYQELSNFNAKVVA